MNFQAVEAANGNNVTIQGTFVEIGGASYTANQKAKAKCKIRDMTGVSHNVHIYQGKGFLPGPQNLNQRHEFTLSSFQGTYEDQPYTGYAGFWNSNNAQGAPQQAPQQGQQAPPQQPAPQGGNNSTPDMIKARSMGLAYAKDLVVAGASKGLEGLFPLAQQCTAFITTGNVPPWDPETQPQGKPQPATDDDKPW